jgi:hypothetical protein
MNRSFLRPVLLGVTTLLLAACSDVAAPVAPTLEMEEVVGLNKTNWNGVKLEAGSARISESGTYIEVDFVLTGLGNNRSAEVVATANNLEIEIECVRTHRNSARNGKTEWTKTRTIRNWRGSNSFAIDRNGRLTGQIELDWNNSDKQNFCNSQGQGWNYAERSVVFTRGSIDVSLGDKDWNIVP